jgi:hypothetical protein
MDRNERPLDRRHLEVPSVVPEKISLPVVHPTQTMHRSCVEINTISKRSETSFHLTNITEKCAIVLALRLTLSPNHWEVYHRVCQKRFPSLWYIRHKPYTVLALRLTLSPNGPKRLSTWHTSPRCTIRCAQNDFHAYGTFGANHAPIWRID